MSNSLSLLRRQRPNLFKNPSALPISASSWVTRWACSVLAKSPMNSKILNLVSAGQRSWISKGWASAARIIWGIKRWPIMRVDAVDWQVGSVMTEDGVDADPDVNPPGLCNALSYITESISDQKVFSKRKCRTLETVHVWHRLVVPLSVIFGKQSRVFTITVG